MPKDPLVSVIINCYNGAKHLREAIDSVYGQTYQNWEIVFWDNASEDSSADIVKLYDNKIRYYLSKSTTPLGEARNLATKKSKGDYIVFLDCDDSFLPGKLATQVTLMEGYNFSMCYSGVIVIDECNQYIKKRNPRNNSGYLIKSLLRKYEINMQGVMLRSVFLNERNLEFSTSLSFAPDYDLFMEIACISKIGVIPSCLSRYRVSENSLSLRTLHLAEPENRYTLNRLKDKYPQLKNVFYDELTYAYGKLHYLAAVSEIYNNNKSGARKILAKSVTLDFRYLILYILLLLPISKSNLIKIIGR